MIVRYRKAVDALLATLGLRARLRCRWYKPSQQRRGDGDFVAGPNDESAMISPAVTDDQNVTDFDPLKFRLE